MATKTTKKSVTSESILGQAAQQITKAVSELSSATETIKELTSKSEDLSLQVANKEEQIAQLDIQYAEKDRQLKVKLDLDFKTNSEHVVNEFLSTNGKTSISKTELDGLKKELADTKANAESETKKAVASVATSMKSQYENDIRFLQSENKASAAENASKIATLADKNAFLEAQTSKLFLQLEAERAAGVERAKAGSIGQITVGDSNRK